MGLDTTEADETCDLWRQADDACKLSYQDQNGLVETAFQDDDDPEKHVCVGSKCKFCVATQDGLTCTISGFTFQLIAVNDSITAGNVHSLDENGVASSEMAAQQFKRRGTFNVCQASKRSFTLARGIRNSEKDDNEFIDYGVTLGKQLRRIVRKSSMDDDARRCRKSKRDTACVNLTALVVEAKAIFDCLMLPPQQSIDASSAAGRNGVHRYVTQCESHGTEVDISKLHRLVVEHDKRMVQKARREVVRRECHTHTRWYTTIREHICRLAVCLWQCAVNSPYMACGNHTNDNFRPFVAGIFFSIKRGVTLPSGAIIVPKCLALSAVLPSTRITHQPVCSTSHHIFFQVDTLTDPYVFYCVSQGNTHQIHLSSHKGVCTLHRSVRSIPTEQSDAYFKEAVIIANVLYDLDRLKSR